MVDRKEVVGSFPGAAWQVSIRKKNQVSHWVYDAVMIPIHHRIAGTVSI
jgi:hypothetical protein